MQLNTNLPKPISIQLLKSGPICWELSRTLEINHFIFEVGSRKSEVRSRKSQVASRKSEVGSRKSLLGFRILRQLLNFTPLIVLLSDSSKISHLGQYLEFSRQQTLSRPVGLVTGRPVSTNAPTYRMKQRKQGKY